jgi:hypothetical protein
MRSILHKQSLLALVVLLAGCATTITQTATPVALSPNETHELCVIENPDVFGAFLPAMREALVARGVRVKVLPATAQSNACALTATYVAYRSWDMQTYMSKARVDVYRDGKRVGEAIYDAPKAGMAITTRIFESTESKVETMVAQLFPSLPRVAQPQKQR